MTLKQEGHPPGWPWPQALGIRKGLCLMSSAMTTRTCKECKHFTLNGRCRSLAAGLGEAVFVAPNSRACELFDLRCETGLKDRLSLNDFSLQLEKRDS